MNIHLYHAQTHALHAAESMSGAAWANKLSGIVTEDSYIRSAREQLALAAAELNAYDAKRQAVTPANAA